MKETGVSTAIESIYRDLEYARSLIKRANADDEETDSDHLTHKDRDNPLSGSGSHSGYSSSGSARRTPSEDWSVISEPQSDPPSSVSSQYNEGRLTSSAKRTSFTAAVLSVLPDSFTTGPSRSHQRSSSASS